MLFNYLLQRFRRLIHRSAVRRSNSPVTIQPSSGFTLIELLVALIIGSIIVTVLLGFMNSILQTDRQEQAKASTEQEIQAAIDYITEDLRESIYIYDADGLYRDHNTTAANSGIRDQIPPVAGSAPGCSSSNTSISCTPILVFWKRQLRSGVVPVPNPPSTPTPTGCSATSPKPPCNDTFVYSLVGYYLITVRNPNQDPTWLGRARIARFAIQDGVKNPLAPTISPLPATPRTNPRNFNYQKSDQAAGLTNNATDCFSGSSGDRNCPSPGFQLFDPKPVPNIELKNAMNQWKKDTTAYSTPLATLIDHVDHSLIDPLPGAARDSNLVRCGSVSSTAQQIPASSADPKKPLPDVPGLFACVDSANGLVQVEIRGNSRTRLYRRNQLNQIGLTTVGTTDSTLGWVSGNKIPIRSTYFPIARTQVVRANSFLNNK